VKIGDVVFVKTSDEPVLVLGHRKVLDSELGKKFPEVCAGANVIIARRPTQTEAAGLGYQLFDFLEVELETRSDHSQRIYDGILERQKLAMADLPQNQFSKPS
jgi:hypothetical protein